MAVVQVGQDESELSLKMEEKEGQVFDRMLKPAPYMGQAMPARHLFMLLILKDSLIPVWWDGVL